jgi:hypothetical protein
LIGRVARGTHLYSDFWIEFQETFLKHLDKTVTNSSNCDLGKRIKNLSSKAVAVSSYSFIVQDNIVKKNAIW